MSNLIANIDGISFRLKHSFDLSFLNRYGRVFKAFDDQDSGNLCFGVEGDEGRLFIKLAGGRQAEGVYSAP